jgi:hypothetical protein
MKDISEMCEQIDAAAGLLIKGVAELASVKPDRAWYSCDCEGVPGDVKVTISSEPPMTPAEAWEIIKHASYQMSEARIKTAERILDEFFGEPEKPKEPEKPERWYAAMGGALASTPDMRFCSHAQQTPASVVREYAEQVSCELIPVPLAEKTREYFNLLHGPACHASDIDLVTLVQRHSELKQLWGEPSKEE